MIAWILLGLGCLVTVSAPIGAAVVGDFYRRLHFLTPVTSIGGPLIGVALAVANGWSPTTVLVLLVVVILAVTGPVLAAATGRSAAERDGLVDEEPPS